MMSTIKCFERLRSRGLCRDCERGSLSVELAIAVPIIVLITLFVVQRLYWLPVCLVTPPPPPSRCSSRYDSPDLG